MGSGKEEGDIKFSLLLTISEFCCLGQWDPLREPASSVPSLIPWQGPFHVSLNVEESTVLLFRPVFEKLYKKLFGQNKVTVNHFSHLLLHCNMKFYPLTCIKTLFYLVGKMN